MASLAKQKNLNSQITNKKKNLAIFFFFLTPISYFLLYALSLSVA